MLINKVSQAVLIAALAGTLASAQVPEVNRRAYRQQDRIGQGFASGQLTAGEAARLERQQGRIDRQIRRDRFENGGALTSRERCQINREQDRASARIYADRHNAWHR